MQQSQTKNKLQLLPFDVQLLIYEFSGEHRDNMQNVLKYIKQRGLKRQLNERFVKNAIYKCVYTKRILGEIRSITTYEKYIQYNRPRKVRCIECETNKIALLNQGQSLHEDCLCSWKCANILFKREPNLLLQGSRFYCYILPDLPNSYC